MILNENELYADYQRIKRPSEKICAYLDTYNTQYNSALEGSADFHGGQMGMSEYSIIFAK